MMLALMAKCYRSTMAIDYVIGAAQRNRNSGYSNAQISKRQPEIPQLQISCHIYGVLNYTALPIGIVGA